MDGVDFADGVVEFAEYVRQLQQENERLTKDLKGERVLQSLHRLQIKELKAENERLKKGGE